LGDTQPTIAEVIRSAGHQTWMTRSELGSLPPLRGILLLSTPAHVPSAFSRDICIPDSATCGLCSKKPCVDRFLILGDRLTHAVKREYKVGAKEAARSVLRRPSLGDGAFTLNCCFSRRLPFCRLETTLARQGLGGAEGEA